MLPNESRISCVLGRPQTRQTLSLQVWPPQHDSFMRMLGGGFTSPGEKAAHVRKAIGVVTLCYGLRSL